ncbi:MAG: RNA polymerase sigma factor [Nostocoides sp.]
MSDSPHADFEAMFHETSPRVYAYARRHANADVAPDIVSEVYLVAWRRRARIPDQPIPWLLVVARNALHRHWRTRSRQERLAAELTGIAALAATSPASVEDQLTLVDAFGELSEEDRETLLLVGWDGLTPQQAATVVGCSPNTFSARLSRARRRLSDRAGDTPPVRPTAVTIGD